MTLTEVVCLLEEKFPQRKITTDIFDFDKKKEIKSLEPKYFFRGESKLYDNTKTTLSRLVEGNKLNQYEWCEFISVHFHLYLFIREAFWGISVVENKDHNKPFIELAIAGILQHYGFDTSFLDFTSDINIAANFASNNNVGEMGRILVIESDSLNKEKINYYFDLTKCPGLRPKIQSSYVIWDQLGQLDLKDENFLHKHGGQWYDFEIDKRSKAKFQDHTILNTIDDEVVIQINDWWNFSDIKSKLRSSNVMELIDLKVNKLIEKSG